MTYQLLVEERIQRLEADARHGHLARAVELARACCRMAITSRLAAAIRALAGRPAAC
jgi:hypothetical protein